MIVCSIRDVQKLMHILVQTAMAKTQTEPLISVMFVSPSNPNYLKTEQGLLA